MNVTIDIKPEELAAIEWLKHTPNEYKYLERVEKLKLVQRIIDRIVVAKPSTDQDPGFPTQTFP